MRTLQLTRRSALAGLAAVATTAAWQRPAAAATHQPAAAARPPVTVLDATMRAPREGFDATVIALKLVAAEMTRIVGASLPGARAVRLMTMARDGSVVQMQPLSAIELPAGQTVELRTGEGGRYLMALHLRPAPPPGRVLRLQLDLVDAQGRSSRQQVPLRVLPARGGAHGGADDLH